MAAAKGLAKGLPQRVIDILQPNDVVVVVDLFGKITFGTFGGDNLHTAIWAATKNRVRHRWLDSRPEQRAEAGVGRTITRGANSEPVTAR